VQYLPTAISADWTLCEREAFLHKFDDLVGRNYSGDTSRALQTLRRRRRERHNQYDKYETFRSRDTGTRIVSSPNAGGTYEAEGGPGCGEVFCP
jgi:hypothetical protein